MSARVRRTRAVYGALAASMLAACTLETAPFGPQRGRVVKNAYGTTPTGTLVGRPCPALRPLDNAPCADIVPLGAQCEYAAGPRANVENVAPLLMVRVSCTQTGAAAPRWLTIWEPDVSRVPECGATSDSPICVDSECLGYLVGTCACAGNEVARVSSRCGVSAAGCPPLRPHHGTPCTGSPSCDYDACGYGARMECAGGIWQLADAVCP